VRVEQTGVLNSVNPAAGFCQGFRAGGALTEHRFPQLLSDFV